MIKDVNLENRETHIYYWENDDRLFPHPDLYPSPDLFPSDVDEIENIVSGSMKLDELIVDSEIKFGELFASKFEVQVFNMPADISGKYIQVYQQDEGVYKPVFSGQIVSCKQDNTGLDRTIVAYDMAYIYREKDVSDWWLKFWEDHGTATIKQCRESLLDYMKIAYDKVTMVNDDVTVKKNVSISSIAFGTVLSMLCELNVCFPHFNRDGVLEFIRLTTTQSINIDGQYEGLNSSFEDFVTDTITGVEFFDSEGELKYLAGDITNTYKLSSNIFCYDMGTFQLKQIGTKIIVTLKGMNFTPANVKMIVGDLSFKLGTYVQTKKGNFFIFENQYSSAQLTEQTMICKGSKSLGESSRSLTDQMLILNEKWSRLTFNVETFKLEFGDYQKEVDSKFEMTAEKIVSEVARGTKNMKATYQGAYIPTSDNYPANEWIDENTRAKNVGATFYNTAEGRVYRWTEAPNSLLMTFDKTSYIDEKKAAIWTLYKKGNSYCISDPMQGSLGGKSFIIPSSEFYILLINNDNSKNYYGFSIASINTGYEENPESGYGTAQGFDDILSKATVVSGAYNKPESEHPLTFGTKAWKWTTGLGVSAYGSKYGWVPQEGYAYSRIEQTADSIKSEVAAREFSEQGIRTDYLSKITQTSQKIETEITQRKQGQEALSSRITQLADSITLVVKDSTQSLSTRLSLEKDQITLESGRLIIKTGNFTLDKNGNVTMNDAKLDGNIQVGLRYGGKLSIYAFVQSPGMANGKGILSGTWDGDIIEQYETGRGDDMLGKKKCLRLQSGIIEFWPTGSGVFDHTRKASIMVNESSKMRIDSKGLVAYAGSSCELHGTTFDVYGKTIKLGHSSGSTVTSTLELGRLTKVNGYSTWTGKVLCEDGNYRRVIDGVIVK